MLLPEQNGFKVSLALEVSRFPHLNEKKSRDGPSYSQESPECQGWTHSGGDDVGLVEAKQDVRRC